MKRYLCAVLALALFGASGAPAIPKTAPGKIFAAWLSAFDSGNRAEYKAFLEQYRSDSLPHLDDIMQFRQMSGGFDLKAVESSTPQKLVVLLEDRLNEQFARMTVVASASPLQAKDLEFAAVPRPAAFAPVRLSQSALLASLGTKLSEDASAGRFSGAVLVAENGSPVFERAYGLADREKGVPNTLDTRFRIGSMNKMFTATAVLQLAQAGKIDLQAPFGTYVTDYPNKDVASAVTIAELLTHTGGTGDIFGPEFDANRLQLRTLDDYEKLYGTRGLEFAPGSKWEYSNYGFILLGLVVERVSGENYYDYVREHVFIPAGMTATDSQPEDVAVPNRSTGYMRDERGQWTANTDTLPYRGTSAGGGYSTVGDLLKFADALLANKLLNARYTQLLTTGKVATGQGDARYAYGFDEHTINGVRCFGHGGGAPGMNGDLEICPSTHYIAVSLSNLDPPAAERINDWIANRLPLAPAASARYMSKPPLTWKTAPVI